VPENIDSPVVCRIGAIELDGQILIPGYPPKSNLDQGVAIFRKTSMGFALLDHDAAHAANAASGEFWPTMLIVRLLIEITPMIEWRWTRICLDLT
jgi:hypothetical protein